MNAENVTPIKSMAQFDEALKSVHMLGQWKFDAALQAAKHGPKSYGIPYVWKRDVVLAKVMEACEVLPKSNDARRNMSFRNPGTDGGAATQSISVGLQAVVPGEVCWAHRHSIDAMRFAVQGHPKLYTVVNGERMPLETGDLVLTPLYSWHDHHNESDQVGIWLDVLATPMMFSLNQIFYEEFGEHEQPLRQQGSDYIGGRGGLIRPAWEQAPAATVPYRYPWRDVQAALKTYRGSPGSPFDGLVLRYANPFTGGPTFPTMDCWVQLLLPAQETQQHRQTSSAIYYVIEGEGTTVVGDHELKWETGDTFCVPNWLWHRHLNCSNTQDALLFTVSDTPALMALGLYREEPRVSPLASAPPAVPADHVRMNLTPMLVRQ